jgi:hypothetical protein
MHKLRDEARLLDDRIAAYEQAAYRMRLAGDIEQADIAERVSATLACRLSRITRAIGEIL